MRPLLLLLFFASAAHGQCPLVQITAADAAPGDHYGQSVSVSLSTVLVGAEWDGDGGFRAGSAYVLERTPAGLVAAGKWIASDAAALDLFGAAIAIDGDMALVGAPGEDTQATNGGAVYVFERSMSGWSEVQKLLVFDPADENAFGGSISMSGGWAVIGAELGEGVALDCGAAYVFEATPTGWVQDQRLIAPNGAQGDGFGAAVDIDGGDVLVGAPGFDLPVDNAGRVYAFERAGGTWSVIDQLEAPLPLADDAFGSGLAQGAGRSVIGAPGHDGLEVDSGGCFAFVRAAQGWSFDVELVPATVSTGDRLGAAVALEGVDVILGAPGAGGAAAGPGEARHFQFDGVTWVAGTVFSAASAQAGDEFAHALALSNDGLLIAAPLDDGAAGNAGAVYATSLTASACAPGTAYCFCDVDAPCGNNDPLAGCATGQAGGGALLIGTGTPSVLADDLVLSVSGLGAGEPGIVYMGVAAVRFAFGDGLRCVGQGGVGSFRFPFRHAGGAGVFTEGPGIVAHSQSSFSMPGQIGPGQTWHFQGWFRDPFGPCGSGFNFTNAYSVTFSAGSGPLADLEAISMQLASASVEPALGETIDVFEAVENTGVVAAGSFRIGVYLSTDSVVTSLDTLLGSRSVLALDSAMTSGAGQSLDVPAGTEAGTYYVGVIVDDLGALAELNEANNTLVAATPLEIVISPPPAANLLMEQVSGASGTVAPGDTIQLVTKVKNDGDLDAGPFRVGIYLSDDDVITSSDVLIGTRDLLGLTAGFASATSAPFVIPLGTQTGDYRVGALADDLFEVDESDEDDNELLASGVVTVAIPAPPTSDLIVSSCTLSATMVDPGDTLTVFDTARNQGLLTSNACQVAYFLSTDAVIDLGDTFLGLRDVAALAGSGEDSGSSQVTIPLGTAPGTYRIGAYVDVNDAAPESDEDNNTLAASGQISVP